VPFCQTDAAKQVNDRRPTEDGACITAAAPVRYKSAARVSRRSRACNWHLMVLTRLGRRVPSDRDKLASSISIALRKAAIEEEQVSR